MQLRQCDARLILGVLMIGHIHDDGDAARTGGGAIGRLLTPVARRARGVHEGMYGLAGHADWYDRAPGRLARPLYRRIAADVAGARLRGGAFVLDVGTGPGRVPLLIAQRCPSLIVEGIDLSEQMIARAAQAASAAEGDRVTYRVADVRTLPYPDASIDLVVSSLSLHHWTDVPAGLAEIRRVLRPGGRAWIYDVRPVLRRVAENAARCNLPVSLEPLDREPGRPFPARLWTAVTAHLINRLTVTRVSAGVTQSHDGPAPD
jgi:ubiquinone/menaquinone biosynthesis C-methylase UbiE